MTQQNSRKTNENIQRQSQNYLKDITDKVMVGTFKEQASTKNKSHKYLYKLSIFLGLLIFAIFVWSNIASSFFY